MIEWIMPPEPEDDDEDHWQSLDQVLRRVLEKAERAFQQNRKPEDEPT